MSKNILILLPSFFFFCSVLVAENNCLRDEQCAEYYTCYFGECVIGSLAEAGTPTISVKQGVSKMYDKSMGYNMVSDCKDVVLGAISLESPNSNGDYLIQQISFKLEKSDNLEIVNIRLVNDVNNNGEFDDYDKVVMTEPLGSWGPFSRFLEYAPGEKLLSSDLKKINLIFVSDFLVDKENEGIWPTFGGIDYITSIKFSENVWVLNDSSRSVLFYPVALTPWGKILFFDTENAILIPDSYGSSLQGITIMATEDTKIRRITFYAFSSYADDGWSGKNPEADGENTFLRLIDPAKGEKIFSAYYDDSEKVFDIEYYLKAFVPVEMTIESDGMICGETYQVNFDSESIILSDYDFQIAGLPFNIEGSTFQYYEACTEEDDTNYGCAITVF